MKKAILSTAVLVGLVGATQATAQTAQTAQPQEIGYAEGSLGYQAMVDGDYNAALAQLQDSDSALANDPAHMINLGSVYAQLGRIDAAAAMYRAAIDADQNFDIVLANGQVMSTREAARRALRGLSSEIAAR